MSLPVVYTEAALKAFMHTELGAVATALGWTVAGGSYDEIVNDVIVLSKTNDLATTPVGNARTLARLCVWQHVCAQTVSKFNLSIGPMKLSREDFNRMAQAQLSYAESRARAEKLIVSDWVITIKRGPTNSLRSPYDNATAQ